MRTITIVIPTINEVANIGKVIDAIPKNRLKIIGYNTEILVVDTNSTDGTQSLAKKKGAIIVTEPKRGYGRAYKTGFNKAKGEIIATLDADQTYPANAIPELVKMLEDKNIDFISGSRLNNFKEGAFTKTNLVGNHLLNLMILTLFGKKLNDSQSGMWVFKKNCLKRLALKSDGMEFSTEIKLEAQKKLKFAEFDIVYVRRKGQKKLNWFKDGMRIGKFLLKRRFTL